MPQHEVSSFLALCLHLLAVFMAVAAVFGALQILLSACVLCSPFALALSIGLEIAGSVLLPALRLRAGFALEAPTENSGWALHIVKL
jgi:hypothetical protein